MFEAVKEKIGYMSKVQFILTNNQGNLVKSQIQLLETEQFHWNKIPNG